MQKNQEKIENLSNIAHLDSNLKSFNKENLDMNRRDDRVGLKEDYLIS